MVINREQVAHQLAISDVISRRRAKAGGSVPRNVACFGLSRLAFSGDT